MSCATPATSNKKRTAFGSCSTFVEITLCDRDAAAG
jgi:hypothetical protein